jgi:hypothetical protein
MRRGAVAAGFAALCLGAAGGPPAWGAATAALKTADTAILLQAGADAPRLLALSAPGARTWPNLAPEGLIDRVEIGGRSVPVHWRLDPGAGRAEERSAVFVYVCDAPKLRLEWEWRARADFGPIEHSIRIVNAGPDELWLPLQDSFRFDWLEEEGRALERVYVEKGAGAPSDIGVGRDPMPTGFRWEGRSSSFALPADGEPREIIPWVAVERTTGTRGGWYAGVEFSGRTLLSLNRRGDSLSGSIGLDPVPGPFRTRLRPGESFETPTVFVSAYSGDADDAGNVLRRWVRRVLGNQRAWDDPNYPLLVNNSWGSGMQVDEALALRMIKDSAELGFDMFHIDAGWFRAVGDWHPDPVKFPRGLAVVADEAHRLGLKFGLWSAWTQAGVGTGEGALSVRDSAIRSWLISEPAPDWKPEAFKGRSIDLGVPAAQAWAERETDRIVTDYRLDMLEHDGYVVAKSCDRADHPHDSGPTNPTDVSARAARAYYEIYSKLRRGHPDLLLEACNDGGRMVDFGSAAHVDYFSITDSFDPLSNRRAFYDASHVLPPAMLEAYVERWAAPRIENFRYMLRSGMMGWLTIMLDTSAWSPKERAAAAAEFKLYRTELRPLIRDADLYHASARPDGVGWDGIEYFDPRRGRGAVYAFRGSDDAENSHAFVLRGLRPDASYEARFQDGSSPDAVMTGRELLASGLKVSLPFPQSSELILLRELGPR